ncbi:MAG TPA: hypothetical protein VFW33_22830 [Gemmataceae bacterium]|nr:hypothetical protein [Gemmataceae bacterium]
MTLTEFLKQESGRWNARAAERAARRDEWVQSLERLMGQITQWLKEADTEGALAVKAETKWLREKDLGEYAVPSLRISLGDREVEISPRSRNTVGTFGEPSHRSQGLVEMTDGTFKYLLYRLVDERGERWLLVDDEDYSYSTLDRASLETALVKLFS